MVLAADFPDEPPRVRLDLTDNYTGRVAAAVAGVRQLDAALRPGPPLLWEGDQA